MRSHLRMLPQSLLQILLSAYHMNLQLVIPCLRPEFTYIRVEEIWSFSA